MGDDTAKLKDYRLSFAADEDLVTEIYRLCDDDDRTISYMLRRLVEIGLIHVGDTDGA